MTWTGAAIKRMIVLTWLLYMFLVLATNMLDGLHGVGLLPSGWRWFSGNYDLIVQAARQLPLTAPLGGAMYLGVLAWEAALIWWLWRAWARMDRDAVYTAFGWGLALWAAFLVADELFLLYRLEAVHVRLFTAQLASLLAVELLPD